jgi:hypothetical protein
MSLAKAFEVIDRMAREGVVLSYAIGGAIAALVHIEPTATEDLDVFIEVEAAAGASILTLDSQVAFLKRLGYAEWRKEGIVVEGWPVQFLPVGSALEAEAVAEAEIVDFPAAGPGAVRTRFVRPEHLLAIALKVKRAKDYIRIDAFLDVDAVDIAKLAAVIERHGLRADWNEFLRRTGRPDPFVPASRP